MDATRPPLPRRPRPAPPRTEDPSDWEVAVICVPAVPHIAPVTSISSAMDDIAHALAAKERA